MASSGYGNSNAWRHVQGHRSAIPAKERHPGPRIKYGASFDPGGKPGTTRSRVFWTHVRSPWLPYQPSRNTLSL